MPNICKVCQKKCYVTDLCAQHDPNKQNTRKKYTSNEYRKELYHKNKKKIEEMREEINKLKSELEFKNRSMEEENRLEKLFKSLSISTRDIEDKHEEVNL